MQVLAIDPGREKCGVALVSFGADSPLRVLERAIWPRAQFLGLLSTLMSAHEVQAFVLGDATSSRDLRAELERAHPDVPIHIIDERNSTLEARPLFWEANPPRGWRRLIPLSLQAPPRAIDDFAAQVLAVRFAHAQKTQRG